MDRIRVIINSSRGPFFVSASEGFASSSTWQSCLMWGPTCPVFITKTQQNMQFWQTWQTKWKMERKSRFLKNRLLPKEKRKINKTPHIHSTASSDGKSMKIILWQNTSLCATQRIPKNWGHPTLLGIFRCGGLVEQTFGELIPVTKRTVQRNNKNDQNLVTKKTRAGCHFPTKPHLVPIFVPCRTCRSLRRGPCRWGRKRAPPHNGKGHISGGWRICSPNWTISSPKRGKKSKGLKPTSRFSEFPQNESVKKAWNRSSKGGAIRPI